MADTRAVPLPTEADASADAKGGKRKLVVVAVVVLAVVAVVAKMFLLPSGAADGPPPPPEEGTVVTIGQMTTSLAGGGTHYARVEIAAVANAAADATALEERFPLMRDEALSVLMGFTPDQLRTVEGADALRAALTDAAQEVWEDDQVLRIVLTDLLVQ